MAICVWARFIGARTVSPSHSLTVPSRDPLTTRRPVLSAAYSCWMCWRGWHLSDSYRVCSNFVIAGNRVEQLSMRNSLAVSACLSSDALDSPAMETLRYFMLNTHALAQWVPPLVLAVLPRCITMRWKHQLAFPIHFMIIPVVFYAVDAAAQLDLGALRRDGWLFDMAEKTGGGEDKRCGYHFGLIQFTPLWMTLPILFTLTYSIIYVIGLANRSS
ncbi:hypothetical protein EV702DRAFT_1250819 [Suillus placidus]|uniref:Uncharacterized protein n=1 Tax=Suillus placidus TaxID=48579 RepID=A0A9P6ZKM3_9AGAM|nr:hypothetical protein EV702DRAFT_1250819 [Suillus placidus]